MAPQASKIKRGTERLVIELESTPDILADVSRRKGDRILVGFAAETDHVAEHARQKLEAKAADMIVANDVTAAGAGFDHDTNIITLYTRDGGEKSFAAHEQVRRRPARPRRDSCIAPNGASRSRCAGDPLMPPHNPPPGPA